MILPDPSSFEWRMEDIEIPIGPGEADVLNRYISGMQRVKEKWTWRVPSVNKQTTRILGVDLRNDLIDIHYSGDCCLTDDILDILNNLIREIDRRYILRMMELKKIEYPSANLGSDAEEMTWTYGNFRRQGDWRTLMETAPLATDSIMVECRVYNDHTETINYYQGVYKRAMDSRSGILTYDYDGMSLWQRIIHKLGNWLPWRKY
jgi:hypothetical protein